VVSARHEASAAIGRWRSAIAIVRALGSPSLQHLPTQLAAALAEIAEVVVAKVGESLETFVIVSLAP
jgi:hypothetical protein